MHSTTVDLASASLSDAQLSHVFPLVYTDLRGAHQQLLDEASGDGTYTACPPIPNTTESFVNLAKKRIDRQWETFGGKPENRPQYLQTAYLERDDELLELVITVEDMVIS